MFGLSGCAFGLSVSGSEAVSSIRHGFTGKSLVMFCNDAATSPLSPSDSDSYEVMRGVSRVSRDSRSFSIAPRAWVTFLCSCLFVTCKGEGDGVRVGDIRETTYLTLLSRTPHLPIEYADSAYVVFVELLDHPVPPKDVAILVGCGSKVEPLGNESAITRSSQSQIPRVMSSEEWPTRRQPSPAAL
jgi:hypothetical protein